MALDKQNLKEQLFGAEENSAAKMDPEKLSRFRHIAEQMYSTPQLSTKEVAMPALAKVGKRVSEMIERNYRTVFFVSVLRLDMVYVTIILALIAIYDVLNNPLMGIAYDRTRTRWGKARPYALFAPFFYFGSTALLFCGRLFFDNDVTDDPRKILFVFSVLFLQETFSTIYSIPVDNYLTLMTPNPQDRMTVGMWQSYANRWAGDFLGMLITPLLDFSRSGYINISQGMIFAIFGLISALTGTAGSMLMSVHCRERVILQPKPAPTAKTLFYILKNKYALRNFAAGMAGSWWSSGNYNWHIVNQLEILGGIFRSAPFYLPRQLSQVISIAFVEPSKKLFGGSYRKTCILFRIMDILVTVIPATIGLSTKITGTWWKAGLLFAGFDFLLNVNDGPASVLEGEIDREIGDYTEYMTGERPDGTVGLLTGLIGKVTEPLRALFTIFIFRWTGYDPNVGASRAWSQDLVRSNMTMYSRVFFLCTLESAIPNILRVIPYFFYDLEGKKKEEMYAALNERRAMIANESAVPDEMETMMADYI
ncbi:MAG: MFS transporter [Oscillospiraceae bacterium]|nr:MFS transporter [Oscillospiraceae bacterium]